MLLDISADTAITPGHTTSEKRELITDRCPQGTFNREQVDTHSIHWYPMRVTYSRELKLKEILDNLNIECFIPMQYIIVEEKGKSRKKHIPAIHNLIFVKSSRSVIDEIKRNIEHKSPMRYIMDKVNKKPITVPEKQMDDFIRVSKNPDEKLIHLEYNDFLAKEGEKVRIIEGVFMGVEGKILRINKNKKVVISIKGIAAVAIAYIHPTFLQKI